MHAVQREETHEMLEGREHYPFFADRSNRVGAATAVCPRVDTQQIRYETLRATARETHPFA